MTKELIRTVSRTISHSPGGDHKNHGTEIGLAARQGGVDMPRSGAAGDSVTIFRYFNEQERKTT